MDHGTKNEGHDYNLSFVLFRDEFLKYFLRYHRERVTVQINYHQQFVCLLSFLTVNVGVELMDINLVANTNTYNLIFYHNS